MDYSQQELSSLANRLADKIQFRRPSIGTHTDYVLGKRGKLKFASKEFKRYMSDRFSDFSDNWCLPVAQAPVERIKFKGFVPYDDVKLGTGIMKCLDRNDFERGLQEAALMMTTTGRAFALVTQVDGRARITFAPGQRRSHLRCAHRPAVSRVPHPAGRRQGVRHSHAARLDGQHGTQEDARSDRPARAARRVRLEDE